MSRLERLLTPEVLTFLTVGGAGYVVDVAAFNVFRTTASRCISTPHRYAYGATPMS